MKRKKFRRIKTLKSFKLMFKFFIIFTNDPFMFKKINLNIYINKYIMGLFTYMKKTLSTKICVRVKDWQLS